MAITDVLSQIGTGFLAANYREVEFRSNLFPTVRVNTSDLNNPKSPPNFWARLAKPTVVLQGAAGRDTITIAPLGEANAVTGYLTPIGIALGLIGIGYALGKSGRKR